MLSSQRSERKAGDDVVVIIKFNLDTPHTRNNPDMLKFLMDPDLLSGPDSHSALIIT